MFIVLSSFLIILFVGCESIVEKDCYHNDILENHTNVDNIQINTIATGSGFSLFIDENNNLFAWGRNDYGQLGDGTATSSNQLVFVMSDVASVSSDSNHVMAIRKDGSLWAWGNNEAGQLGDGTTTNRYDPVHIMDDVVFVNAASRYTMAIKNDGTLWAWGNNNSGQIGNGTVTNTYNPVLIMDDVLTVSGLTRTTMAIRSDGSLWAWGVTDFIGFLEDSYELDLYPIRIAYDVTSVSAGVFYAAMIKDDDTLWTWGTGFAGVLGNGMIDRRDPQHISDDIFNVAAGGTMTMAVTTDGVLLTWGGNFRGELGDGTTTDRDFPIPIMHNIVAVSNGIRNSLALKTDGSLWGWGTFEHPLYGSDLIYGDNMFPVRIVENVMLPTIIPSISDSWDDFLGDPTFPSADHPLIGVWEREDDSNVRYIFRMTGEGQSDGMIMSTPFTWRVGDNQLAVYTWHLNRTERIFTIEDNVLIMEGHPLPDSSYRFIRQ